MSAPDDEKKPEPSAFEAAAERARWKRCWRCGTTRPPARLVPMLRGHPGEEAAARLGGVGELLEQLRCCDEDLAFCSRMAGVGKGELPGNLQGD